MRKVLRLRAAKRMAALRGDTEALVRAHAALIRALECARQISEARDEAFVLLQSFPTHRTVRTFMRARATRLLPLLPVQVILIASASPKTKQHAVAPAFAPAVAIASPTSTPGGMAWSVLVAIAASLSHVRDGRAFACSCSDARRAMVEAWCVRPRRVRPLSWGDAVVTYEQRLCVRLPSGRTFDASTAPSTGLQHENMDVFQCMVEAYAHGRCGTPLHSIETRLVRALETERIVDVSAARAAFLLPPARWSTHGWLSAFGYALGRAMLCDAEVHGAERLLFSAPLGALEAAAANVLTATRLAPLSSLTRTAHSNAESPFSGRV